jgi:hypothetical protein
LTTAASVLSRLGEVFGVEEVVAVLMGEEVVVLPAGGEISAGVGVGEEVGAVDGDAAAEVVGVGVGSDGRCPRGHGRTREPSLIRFRLWMMGWPAVWQTPSRAEVPKTFFSSVSFASVLTVNWPPSNQLLLTTTSDVPPFALST